MAKLIVRTPQRAKLKTTGFIGQPEGDIILSENNKTTNVSSFATATVRVQEPTGTLLITENGEQIDIKDKEFVDVAVPIEIPIDDGSQKPIYFGVDASGFYITDSEQLQTPVAFGKDDDGLYVIGGTQ